MPQLPVLGICRGLKPVAMSPLWQAAQSRPKPRCVKGCGAVPATPARPAAPMGPVTRPASAAMAPAKLKVDGLAGAEAVREAVTVAAETVVAAPVEVPAVVALAVVALAVVALAVVGFAVAVVVAAVVAVAADLVID